MSKPFAQVIDVGLDSMVNTQVLKNFVTKLYILNSMKHCSVTKWKKMIAEVWNYNNFKCILSSLLLHTGICYAPSLEVVTMTLLYVTPAYLTHQ